ncbi:basic helix-loop-helix transcription factor scleraxis [Drosophila rhopaloa]|uniref:Basic helix-loop-helix transcription factor scleraxis n=1 Tax=Drosophila rhopaloa TaxID=1041015 RepID=A0A6P4FDR1_DRORH|nr:basic helix-loop-helix transcription factor scleraxis [Drosophila rhopaloa]
MPMAVSSSSAANYLMAVLAQDSNSSGSASGSASGCSGAAADSEDSQIGQELRVNQVGSRRRPPRQKINARERYRTFNVNSAYEALRNLIPTEPINRKLSKIEIIRLASSYITHLSSTLETGTECQPCLLHKYENEGLVRRISICTFCLKTK